MVKFDFNKTPITQIADYIILAAAKANSSDIHFDPRENGMVARFRIDGELRDYTFIPKTYERNLATRLKLLANMNITENRLPQDGAIKGKFGNLFLDMRVSTLPLNEGEKIVIRILDYSRSLEGLDTLGFSEQNLEKLKRMISVPNGMILITGATGSGKSTTVYSILQTLNKEEANIITVEDPIEMNIEGLNQVQVNSEIGMTFATVLRSILRQDPNIILIGEIRDSETAKIAVRASITGHLVLSTVHTNNALATVERLLDMDVERYLLSSALVGIISQRLAKRLCTNCRIERATTDYEKKLLNAYLGKNIDKVYDVNKDGCNECHNGYKGRIAIQEVLELDDDIRNALNNENLKKDELEKLVYTDKVITMVQDALGKVEEGITNFDELYRIIEVEDIDSIFTKDSKVMDSKNSTTTKSTTKLVVPTFTAPQTQSVSVPQVPQTMPIPTTATATPVNPVPASPIVNTNQTNTQVTQSVQPIKTAIPPVQQNPIINNPTGALQQSKTVQAITATPPNVVASQPVQLNQTSNDISIPIVDQNNTQ